MEQIPTWYLYVTDLKTRFDWHPHKSRAELNSQTMLRCLPPEGKPLPEVGTLQGSHWVQGSWV